MFRIYASAFIFLIQPSLGAISWAWSDGDTGAYSGTFTTTGDLTGLIAPAATYTVTGFTVDQAPQGSALSLGSVADGTFTISQPSVGFIWDGSAPTQFFRSSGGSTNGFAFGLAGRGPGEINRVLFGDGFFNVDDASFNLMPGEVIQSTTVTLAPVPEPSTGILLAGAVLALSMRRRVR